MNTVRTLAFLLAGVIAGCAIHRCDLQIDVRSVRPVIDNSTPSGREMRPGQMLENRVLTVLDFNPGRARVRARKIEVMGLPPLQDQTVEEYYVEIPMTDEGKEKFRTFTGSHINEFLAVLINQKVMMTPLIREAASGPLEVPVDSREAGARLAKQLRCGVHK